MNFTTIHHQIALTFLSGIGSRRARVIVSHFNDLEAFFSEKRLNLSKIPGIPADFVSLKLRLNALMEADKVLHELERIGGTTLFFTEKEYPRRLKQCSDAPLLIYSKGNIDWNPPKIISVVGTRHATDYGKALTQELIDGLAAHHVTVVSGMAYGIDVFAHQEALKKGLPTWGVLGHGLAKMYPSEHRKIAERMLENGGLISEFIPSQKPEPAHFPMRNRIVAGLSDATIVIESGEKGGSLITASLAADYNRDVFAYPGDIHRPFSKGCLNLIRKNQAALTRNSEDIIEAMNWHLKEKNPVQQRSLFIELNPREEKIVSVMQTKTELTLDTIGYLSSLTVSEVSSDLLSLEFKGLVRSLPGRRFQLIT
ncbi:DNA-processing protein DprA [Fluviicola taffensis]|uniref:DNA protecting protein DprA n=1 Tax=Fluviicola taffensis (strain DSM 16823 / NCIMB 13979 / RW262) TaxID=755732 RepID=F2IF88_FLUTR|nr:DNA-processing protein DprA [Fluviicola taffensis]AEA43562.1 DNA protecting protein DprA [Fluviicola taffensis DSM 16823]